MTFMKAIKVLSSGGRVRLKSWHKEEALESENTLTGGRTIIVGSINHCDWDRYSPTIDEVTSDEWELM